MLDHYSVPVHNNQQVAALPQLDRGSDYESERHRFESYTPHHLSLKPPETGAFFIFEGKYLHYCSANQAASSSRFAAASCMPAWAA